MSPNIDGITGRLKLVVGDGEIDLGSIYLPLTVTRVSPAELRGLAESAQPFIRHGGTDPDFEESA